MLDIPEGIATHKRRARGIMKKLLQLLILLFIMALTPAYVSASANANEDIYRIIIDGVDIGMAAGNLLPLRDVVVHTGGTVSWNSRTQQITVRRGNRVAEITIGSTYATVNGREVNLAVPPQLAEGRTMVSLCFFADHMGLGAGHKNNRFILSTTPARQIPILTYHHILPDEVNTRFRGNPWVICTNNFAVQMRYLRDNNFYTPTLDELEAFLISGRLLPANSVMIHFDDGYYSNYVYAYPVLQRYGLRAVIFHITGDAKALGEYQPPICHNSLTMTAAVTLRIPNDVFETASHTHNLHCHVPDTTDTLLVAETRENIVTDTLNSFEFVSNHRAFAYPHGQFNDTVTEALGKQVSPWHLQ